MKRQTRAGLAAAIVLGILLGTQFFNSPAQAVVTTVDAQPVPVEEDMHEFMEYIFEPAFKRLKPAMAAEPTTNAGWKILKGEALVLAEGGNLTLMRAPKEETAAWNELCVEVREHGKGLYTAARMKKFEDAKKSYVAMVHSCNACHEKFAGGEHQLEP